MKMKRDYRSKLTSLPMWGFTAQLVEHRTGIAEVTGSNLVEALAPVPEKTISANRGLNHANRRIKFVLRLDCVPQNTISTIPGIK